MKKTLTLLLIAVTTVLLTSCGTVVQPNYGGVLMDNYGKAGKTDYKEVSGRVNDWGMGTQLFQVPMWEQRAAVEDTLHMQDAKNNEMKCFPRYAYHVTIGRLVDVVFNNSQIAKENSSNGANFLKTVENNVLEMAIYDIVKEQSRKHIADSLMNNGGSLRFEKECEDLIRKTFEEKGFSLVSITIQLTYSTKIMATLDKRLEVSTNVSTLEQEIVEQKKRNELQQLKIEYARMESQMLTPEILEKMRLEKWDGHYPTYYGGGNLPIPVMNTKK